MAIETKKISELTLLEDPRGAEIPASKGGVTYKIKADALLMHGSAYGVRIDSTQTNPTLTRIGNPLLHQTLPVQSLMKRCVLKADGTINYYLDENLSTLKANGSSANLSGADGDVQVHIPKYYYLVEVISSTIVDVWISASEIAGFKVMDERFISAYQATVKRDELKLASVVNTTANYRGGNNSATNDANSASLLGKPATSISRENFRTYARNKGAVGKNGAGWNQFTYDDWRVLVMLFTVEYATLNSQATFNPALDANGYRQGGLGDGVTTLNSTLWGTFNGTNPFIPCGYTNGLGNKTGIVAFTMPTEYDASRPVVQVPSYRGIENPFGHIYHWVDGINIRVFADNAGGRSIGYVTDNPANFNGSNYNGFREAGDYPRANGWIKQMNIGADFDLVVKATGGGSTTHWADHLYVPTFPESGDTMRALFVGGYALAGSNAGLVFSLSANVPSHSSAIIGARLCFHP